MNTRLVLATAPVSLEERYGAFAGAANTEPSFGLACLAASAREAGAAVAIVEAAAGNLPLGETLRRVLDFKPSVVGLTATTSGIEAAAALAAHIKEQAPDTLVLIGGCHGTALPDDTLESYAGFDLAVIGEGEVTLVDILRASEEGQGVPRGITGTVERRDGTIHHNPPRDLVHELDSLPLPAWDLLEGFPAAFRPSPARIRRWPCASVVLTRGCPNRCTFCDRSVFGRMCRAYTPAYAVRMIKQLREEYGVREILIEDDTFIISRKRVAEFCELLLEQKIDITWSCLGRADRVTPELLALMRKAGCWHITYGIESGDAAILKSVNKNLDIPQIRQALMSSRAAGLQTKGFFIVGFPGETEATLAATREVALDLPLDDISVMLLAPFPGSEIYSTASEMGSFDRDWRKMTTIEATFIPNGFTKESLEAARTRLLRDFYFRPGLMLRQALHLIARPRAAWATFQGFLAFLQVLKGTRDA
jgi:anaerobic magnesium-protoporphyrin IX monomethyl ester cyclase